MSAAKSKISPSLQIKPFSILVLQPELGRGQRECGLILAR